ncbi:glycosyltransferase [Sphingomonas sp. BK235]|uniref:glycosyltransferase n=1 Tax=Sphingomonas sp. BK235 TaxID=2512131 RepID=UPI0010ED45F5|nr:glycosyltransferase [Sphingomonas sp. BK235]TCP36095.1 cellulose synthase/poly-beta-1,6-N-acetylglucosamine synthase-like glycosyltransferase [Sphingomonas sp. BK235]
MIVALACLSGVALLLFLHPYISYPLSLRLLAPIPIKRCDVASRHMSLLFSAFNEERALPEKLANLRTLKEVHSSLEILAYDDFSSDGTAALLRENAALLTPVIASERAGKATGMRRMVAQAKGDVCIFTDANVILDEAAITRLNRYFDDPDVGGVAGSLRYINEDASTTAQVGGIYWRLEEHIKQLESRCGSIMGADGSIFAVRRELYPLVPPHLLDDMTVSFAVPLAGKRLVHATDVLAFERSATSSKDEFRRKRRIACRAFNTHRHLWPAIRQTFSKRDLYKYVSHKLIRWFGFPLLLLAIVSAVAALALSDFWWLGPVKLAAALVAMLLGRAGAPVFSQSYEVLMSIAATFVGILDAQRGLTYQTWSPAASRDLPAPEAAVHEFEAVC